MRQFVQLLDSVVSLILYQSLYLGIEGFIATFGGITLMYECFALGVLV